MATRNLQGIAFFCKDQKIRRGSGIPQLAQGLLRTDSGITGWQGYLVLSTLLGLANTFFGIETLSWLGLWFGAKARTQAAAIVWTVGLGKGVPNLVNLVCWLTGAALVETCGFSNKLPVLVLWCLPQVINLLFFLSLIHLIKTCLPEELVGAQMTLLSDVLSKLRVSEGEVRRR